MITILQGRRSGDVEIKISHATGAPMYTIGVIDGEYSSLAPVEAWKALSKLREAGSPIPSKVMVDIASDIINNLAFAVHVTGEEVVA